MIARLLLLAMLGQATPAPVTVVCYPHETTDSCLWRHDQSAAFAEDSFIITGPQLAFVDARRLVAEADAADGGDNHITPVVGESQVDAGDVPLRPPELVDELGNITVLAIPELEAGTVCLTHEKAVIERDNKLACHASLGVMQADPGIDWAVVLGVAGAGVLTTAIGVTIAFFAGQASVKKQ